MLLLPLDHKLLPEEAEVVVNIEEEGVKEVEVEIDHTLPREKTEVEEVEVKEEHQDLMPMVNQSRIDNQTHSEESQEMTILMIGNPELEEVESLKTKRADTENSTMVTSLQLCTSKRALLVRNLLKKLRKRRKSQSQSQSQKWSNSLSLSMSSWLIRPDSAKKMLERPKVSKEPRFRRVEIKKSNLLFYKINTLKTPLQELLMPTMSILVSELLLMMMISPQVEEEEEVVEAVEVAEEMPQLEEAAVEDKILSKPSRKLKKISQHYERDGDPLWSIKRVG